jgi:hypothetical protein
VHEHFISAPAWAFGEKAHSETKSKKKIGLLFSFISVPALRRRRPCRPRRRPRTRA